MYIYGRHVLEEALANAPRAVRKVFLSSEAKEALQGLLEKHRISPSLLKAKEVSRMVGRETSHQGVVAILDPSSLLVPFDDFKKDFVPDADTMLVLLDELTDPQNVGAIIRSAAAFGASGVLLPSHHQAPITAAVVKVSAGMVFSVPIVGIGNVNYALSDLKKMGFIVYGLAAGGSQNLPGEKFEKPSLFVVGNEGKGIREKTLGLCDVKLRIPMDNGCESLNASVSAAVALYAWSLKHPHVLQRQ